MVSLAFPPPRANLFDLSVIYIFDVWSVAWVLGVNCFLLILASDGAIMIGMRCDHQLMGSCFMVGLVSSFRLSKRTYRTYNEEYWF